MKFFYINSNDARWFRHWLRNNLLAFVAITGFLLVLPVMPKATMVGADNVVVGENTNGETPNQPSSAAQHSPVAVLPEGWRRTNRGWEHVSTWRPARPLMVAESTYSGESTWIQITLDKIHDVPPLIFALGQLTLVAVIVNVGHRESDS